MQQAPQFSVFPATGHKPTGTPESIQISRLVCNVSLLSRRQAKNEAAQKLAGQQDVQCVICAGNLADAVDVTAALDQTCEQPDGINYAFNKAGIEQHYKPLAA